MKIIITGDTHGDLTLTRLNKIKKQNPDLIIICGDFSYLWDNSKKEKNVLEFLKNFSIKILWCDGNHENFDLLKQYPKKEWNGGKVTVIGNNLYHLNRGEIYNINNKKFFVFGGANSIDKIYRIENKTWWKDELPTKEEIDYAIDNLKQNQNKVDYIITHTCCKSTLKTIFEDGFYYEDNVSNFLEYIKESVEYEKWFFGHLHLDKQFNKEYALYTSFEVLEI